MRRHRRMAPLLYFQDQRPGFPRLRKLRQPLAGGASAVFSERHHQRTHHIVFLMLQDVAMPHIFIASRPAPARPVALTA